jgi:hypothetical protein
MAIAEMRHRSLRVRGRPKKDLADLARAILAGFYEAHPFDSRRGHGSKSSGVKRSSDQGKIQQVCQSPGVTCMI